MAPKQIPGSQVFNRRADANLQLTLANAEIEKLRAVSLQKDTRIAVLEGEMKTRDDQIKAEMDWKVEAVRNEGQRDKIELQKDLQVSESLKNDLWAENRILKVKVREQKKALDEYHVLYSLQKVYDIHYKKLDWQEQRKAQRLYAKYKSADGDAIKAAFELYEFLEDNGLDGELKLHPDLKNSMKRQASKSEGR